jgi:ABC-2 type transport system permease protein
MRAFAYHFGLEFRAGVRNASHMLMNYLFPLGCYVLFGALLGQINPGFLKTIVPAMSLFALLSGAMLGMPDALVDARNAGVFRSFKVNGVPALSLLAIPVLTSVLHAMVVTALIATTAPLLFHGTLPANWPGFALVFLVAAFAVAGLGALIGVVSSNSRMTVLLTQLVFLPSMILGGLMLPSSVLPDSLVAISRLLPTTYAMDAFAGLAMGRGGQHPWLSLAVLLTGGILALALAVALFSWDSRGATRRAHPAWAAVALLPYLAGMALAI